MNVKTTTMDHPETSVVVAEQHNNDNNNNNNTNNDIPAAPPQLGELWDTLQSEFTNMGRALTCPLCLSTYKDAVLLPCVHAYCESCLSEAFAQGPSSLRCPTCLTKATRRSMAPAPILNAMAKAYKLALRHFGLAPVQFDPSYNAMTQIEPPPPAGEQAAAVGVESMEQQQQQGGGLTMEPYVCSTSSERRRRSSNLVESHTQLLVSRTWHKVLQERQQQANDIAQGKEATATTRAAAAKTSATTTRSSIGSSSSNNTCNNTSTLPPNIPTKHRLHEWYQQQQASVTASHERALITAAADRQKANATAAAPLNLSMQQELAREHALEQEIADRQAEEEAEEWTEMEVDQDDNEQDDDDDDDDDEQQPLNSTTTMNQDGSNTATESQQQEQPPSNTTTQEDRAFFTPREADSNPQQMEVATGVAGSNGATHHDSNMAAVDEQSLSTVESFDTCTAVASIDDADGKVSSNQIITSAAAASPRQGLDKKDHSNGAADSSDDDDVTVGDDDKVVDDQDDNDEDSNDDDETVGEETEEADTDMIQAQHDSSMLGVANTSTAVTMFQPTMSVTTNNDDDDVSNDSNQCNTASNGAPTPRQSNTASRTNPSFDSRSSGAAAYKVGDIVHVQSRTWPGVNKPGGIARICKVFVDSSSYHVDYILGGKEKNVDGIFLSLPPEEMNLTVKDDTSNDDREASPSSSVKNSRERKSRRISIQQQQQEQQSQEIKVKMELELPMDLMKQLAAEGFDVTPRAGSATTGNQGRVGGRVQIKVEGESAGARRSQSETRTSSRTTQTATAARRTQSGGRGRRPRKGRISKKDPVLQTKSAAKQEKKDAQKRNAPPSRAGPTKKPTAPNKRRKISSQEATNEIPPLPECSQEICSLANAHYQDRIQAALNSASVCIVASGLSEDDKAALKSLCKDSKKNGKVQLKQSEVFHAHKTNLCLAPAAVAKKDPKNLVGQCRTLKAMRAAMAGIPLVSSTWIQACRDQKKIVMPSDSMWIRSLPIRSEVVNNISAAHYGVAKIAAQASHRANQCLSNCTVQLFGSFTRPPKADVQILLREAGATQSLQTSSTVAALRNLHTERLLVLICDDGCTSLSEALQRQVKTALVENKTTQVLVVNPQWIFDSIVAGFALDGANYAPMKRQPLALWKLVHPHP